MLGVPRSWDSDTPWPKIERFPVILGTEFAIWVQIRVGGYWTVNVTDAECVVVPEEASRTSWYVPGVVPD